MEGRGVRKRPRGGGGVERRETLGERQDVVELYGASWFDGSCVQVRGP